MAQGEFPELVPELRAAGFDLTAVVSVERYDALVPASWRTAALLPGARAAVLLGCGGPDFFRAARGAPEWRDGSDPIDRFARRCAEAQRDAWRSAGWPTQCYAYTDQRDGQFADFSALAVAGGLGVPSRLGILLHPQHGPWWSLRTLLLTHRPLAPSPPLPWQPCDGCPAPCAEACVADDVVLSTGFDVAACFRTRGDVAACRTRCAARRACVVGRDSQYDAEAEAYFGQHAWLAADRAARGAPNRPARTGLPE